MKVRINKTVVSAAIMLAFSLAVWIAIPFCIAEGTSTGDIGPRAFPRLICIAIAALSILQFAAVLLKIKTSQYIVIDMAVYGGVFPAVLLALLAVAAAKFINPLLAAVVCGLLYLLLLRSKSPKYYIALLLTGGALLVLMKYVMHIRF
jgi:hypothetical protein